jgi:hypothetical protein
MENNKRIWDKVLNKISEDVTEISFDTWFKPLNIRRIDTDLNIAYIEISSDDKRNEFIVTTIKNRYLTILEAAFKSVLGSDFRVVLKPSDQYDAEESKNIKEPEKIEPKKTSFDREKIFNPKYKLEYIGDYAFYTNSITEVEFSNSLKQIGECAFGDNKLTDLFVYNRNSDGTENKKSINSYGGIESTVTIPNQVEEIGLYAFDYAEITNLTLNEGLKYIREGALSDNIFSSITIPSTVEVIEKDALLDNENLSLISNKSGRSFDWSSITGSSYANQIFATGTINHDNGEIQVTN